MRAIRPCLLPVMSHGRAHGCTPGFGVLAVAPVRPETCVLPVEKRAF